LYAAAILAQGSDHSDRVAGSALARSSGLVLLLLASDANALISKDALLQKRTAGSQQDGSAIAGIIDHE
jgi:hypothetical protein